MYSPKIKEDQVRELYALKERIKKRGGRTTMTELVRDAIQDYLNTIKIIEQKNTTMIPAVKKAFTALQIIKGRLHTGQVEYEAAKAEAEPHLEILNEKGREVAKRYRQPYKPVTFAGFMR